MITLLKKLASLLFTKRRKVAVPIQKETDETRTHLFI
jgi:hypothetical protein